MGWRLVNALPDSIDTEAPSVGLRYGHPAGHLEETHDLPSRAMILLVGIDDEEARVRLLRSGFGDVLGSKRSLIEVEARAMRIAAQSRALLRTREIGSLRLDLFARDGFVQTRALGLHPREFALLWRLADAPGEPVAKHVLVRDVWRMAHVPDTNSLAVHISRLRAKLETAGLTGLVQTAPRGGYYLRPNRLLSQPTPIMLADSDRQDCAAMAQ